MQFRSRFGFVFFLAAVALLLPIASRAQTTQPQPAVLLARLSYDSTYGVDWNLKSLSPMICFSVYQNGFYRISRLTQTGKKAFEGNLDSAQLAQFTAMLKNLKEQNPNDGVVKQGTESLVAEIAHEGKTSRYVWIDPDHKRPFPEEAVTLIGWLQTFKTIGAAPLTIQELTTDPVCPHMSSQPFQPVTVSSATHSKSPSAGCGPKNQ